MSTGSRRFDPTPPGDDAVSDPTVHLGALAPVVAPRPFLLILASPVASEIGRLIPIDPLVSLGRSSESTAVIKDVALSRRHLEITRTGSGCVLRDLGSRNGTLVNGALVESIALVPGDQVQVGATVLQFLDGSASVGEAWIKRALATSGVALWEHRAATDELLFSEHVEQALDLPPSTLARRSIALAGCVHADDVDRVRHAVAAARAGSPFELEMRLVLPPSIERWVVLRGRGGDVDDVVAGTILDVTARRRREATLSRTALMFESFLDGVVLTDHDGSIVDLNLAMTAAFGLVRSQSLGQRLFAVVAVPDPARILLEASAAMAATGRWTATLPIGANTHYELLAFPLRTDRGEVAGTTWVFRDVSEKQRMAAQIAFLDRLVSLGTLSAGMAHEINNPLTFILGNAEALRDALADGSTAAAAEMLDDIVQGAQRIAAIVGDLRAFSRADGTAEPSPVDVGAAVGLALKLAGVTARERARLDTRFESTRAALAVESRLVQVLINLILNAAQAIVGDRAQAVITIRTRDDGHGVAIEVTDNGAGMAPEVLTRAFEPFFTTKGMTSSGLGLSICHGLVTGMGGTIALTSDGATGTTARVWLPSAGPLEPSSPSVATIAPPRLRVLVVDDETAVLRVIGRMLRQYDVVAADGYRAAADHLFARREAFDVVLCDLMMPDGTGMELYERMISERPDLASVVVFVTGGALSPESERFLAEPGRRHLLKPMTGEVLRRVVAEVASSRPDATDVG